MNEAEFSVVGTVPTSRLPALMAILAERCGTASGETSPVWERRYKSRLPADKRGLGELRLLSSADGTGATLKAESVDRLSVVALIVARPQPVILARRVSRVPVADDGADHFVAALGFELQHESLRRGWVFQQGATTVSVFELCRRKQGGTGGSDWEALGDDSLRLVEVLVHGVGELAPLANEMDGWVAALQPLVALAPAAGARSAF